MKFQIGQTIKSYDFPSRDDCYMTGEIVSIDRGLIVAKIVEWISQGENIEFEPDGTFTTPAEMMFEDMYRDHPRIEVL